jgi:hypothetical protein
MTFSRRSREEVVTVSSGKNANLANIIESFKKEKSAFNERFSELKKRLDNFNNKRVGNQPGLHHEIEGPPQFNRTAPMPSGMFNEYNGKRGGLYN